jgi:hypothetical protein
LSVSNPSATRGQTLALSTLVAVSDPDQVGYQKLELWDSNGTVGGGQFKVNGVAQTGGQEIDVASADVANNNVVFDVGTLGGTDTLYAQLLQSNGQVTGWKTFTVTAPPDQPPTVAVADIAATTRKQTFAASSLFTATDPDGDTISKYAFWDSGAGGAYFLLNGVPQATKQEIDVTAAQLAQTTYQSGLGADTLTVRAYDGSQWSSWSQSFSVTAPPFFKVFLLNDPQHLSQDAALIADVKAAAADWAQYLDALGSVTISVNVRPTNRASGGPTNSAFVGTDGTHNVFEAGAEYEMLQGVENNSNTVDIAINVDPTYLQNDLWVDPDPAHPSAIPSDRYDAVSIMRHEIAHGFGILSARDTSTGQLTSSFEWVWDKFLQIDPNGSAWFTGPNAEAVYGGRVPVTTVNNGEQYSHLANSVSDGDGQDLMNGIEIDQGRAYHISSLDLAILKDLGLPITTTTVSPGSSSATNASSGGSDAVGPGGTAGIPDTALLGSYMASTFASNALDGSGSLTGGSASAPPQQELLTQPHQA